MKITTAAILTLISILPLLQSKAQNQWTTDVDGGQNHLLNVKKLTVLKAAATASSAQNLLSWSEVLSDGQGWTVQNLDSDHNDAADSSGATTLEKITNRLVGSNAIHQALDVESAAGTYNFSWDVKKGTATNFLYAIFNLTNYQYIIAPVSYAAATNTSTVTRMSITFTKPAGCVKIQVMPYAMSHDTITANPTTGTLYLGRMQVRKSSFPATYIKTEANIQPGSNTAATPARYAIYTDDSSNVAINTTDTKGYKFAVNGDAIFNRAVVKLNSNWPDYVFSKEYKLPSLKVTEAFIKANGHLPNIPKANEVEKTGIDIGMHQTAMMEKIEELTLYIIEQNKKLEALEQKVAALKAAPTPTAQRKQLKKTATKR
jgi:hypothetical protein